MAPDGMLYYFSSNGGTWQKICGPLTQSDFSQILEGTGGGRRGAEELIRVSFDLNDLKPAGYDDKLLRGKLFLSRKSDAIFIAFPITELFVNKCCPTCKCY